MSSTRPTEVSWYLSFSSVRTSSLVATALTRTAPLPRSVNVSSEGIVVSNV
ncbi:hypothetical protein D3C79_1100360 [compost metagenome]